MSSAGSSPSGETGDPRSSPARAALVLALGAAAAASTAWIQADAVHGGRYGVLGLLLATTVVGALVAWLSGRHPTAVRLSLCLFTTAFVAALCADLPPFPSAAAAGDSPSAVPVYAGLGVVAVTACLAAPAALSGAELVVLALVLFCAGNGKVWTRSNGDFFPIYAGLAALALLIAPPRTAQASAVERRTALLAVAFLVWIVVCGVLGEDPGRTDELFGRLAAGAIAGWAAARVLDRAGVERALLVAALSGATVFLAVPAMADAARVLEPIQILRGTRLRLFGLHPNLTGTFIAVELVLVTGLLLGARGWKRVALGAIFLGCVPTLYLTRSRTAWIAAALGLAVLFLARRVSRRTWIAVLGAAAGLFLLVVLVGPIREAVLRPTSSAQSLSQRIYLWDAAARLVVQNPVAGIGLNNYFAHGRTAATPSYFDNTDKSLHPHNLILAVAEGSGLVGLGLFLALLAVIAFAAIRAAREAPAGERAPPAGAIVLATLAALVGANMFDLGLSQTTFVPTLFWLLAGMAVALLRSDVREESPVASHAPAPAPRAVLAIAFALLFGVRPFAGERLFQTGIRLQDRDDPTAALEVWKGARRLLPWATGPVIRSAQVAAAAGLTDEARSLYERAIELSPTHPRFRYRYALFLSNLNRPAQAAEQCGLSLELDPRSPEEGPFRTLHAECLARAGRIDEARAELGRALLAMPDVPGRFEELDWTLPVKAGEPIQIGAVAAEQARNLVTEAPERETWDVRRRGNHLGRILRQLGEPEQALEMLEGIERATGSLDVSLERLRTELRSDLGRDIEGDVAYRAEGKAGALLDVSVDPEVELARAEHELGIVVDMYFEFEIYRELFDRMYDAAVRLGDTEHIDRAITGVLFFCDENKRVEYLVGYADLLAKRGRREEALEFVRDGIRAGDELKHASSREQVAFKLATTALGSVGPRPPRARLAAAEAAVRADPRGATWGLFRIVCRLNLVGADPTLQAEARVLLDDLRERFPGEGESLLRYFDRAGAGPAGPRGRRDR